MLRPIIEIDEEKCNGCGQCVTDCAEGALAIIDGKARLISETYCDGLGACLQCPQNALKLAMREAQAFDEEAALAAKAAREKRLEPLVPVGQKQEGSERPLVSQAPSWPIQLALVPPSAAYLKDARLLLGAHCAGFALPDAGKWTEGRIPLIACPKLENHQMLIDRLAAILAANDIKSIDVLRMSVPCCGLDRIAAQAIAKSGSRAKLASHVVRLGG